MDFTVQNLLDSKQFPSMKPLNSFGLNQPIKNVSIIEVEDVDRICYDGELLLTSLKVYKKMSEQDFLACLDRLCQKQICGFIVKRRIERKTDEKYYKILETFCDYHQLTLIEIPIKQKFWGLAKYIMGHIFTPQMAQLKYFKLTHDNFTNILLKVDNGHDVSKKILHLIEDMIENPVTLYYSNLYCFSSTEDNVPELIFEENLKPYNPNIITKFKYMKQIKDGINQYIVKIDLLNKIEIYLMISEKNKPLTTLDYMALENAIITLQYSFIVSYTQNEIKKKYQRDLGYSMLNGLLNDKQMDAFSHIMQLDDSAYYCVVSFHTIDKNKEQVYTNEQLDEVGIIEGEISKLIDDMRIYRNLDQIVYIHEMGKKETKANFRNKMEKLYKSVDKQIKHRKSNINFQIGIGKIVKGYRHLKDSYLDSKKAIESIDVIRLLMGNNDLSVVDCSKLGFFKIFENMQDREQLLEYVPESLVLLMRNDNQHNGELIKTLQTYLDHNQSTKKTADTMYVNYRTITYRLDKIKDITGIDFDNSGEMLAIRNGLMILKLANKLN